jgi:outer membrane protein OmpA-like peptidoglycan-associated protein
LTPDRPLLFPGCRVLPLLLAALSLPSPARAQEGPRPELRAGFGIGSMVSGKQRDLGFGLTLVPELRPGLRLHERFAAELAFANWIFPSHRGGGHATLLGAGGRFDPWLRPRLRGFVDGHAGVGLTGSVARFMFDLGAGLELRLNRNLAAGPFVRYGQMADSRVDPKFVAGGLLLALSWPPPPPALPPAPPPPPAPRDRDRDGVADAEDLCPDQPQGNTVDPRKKGCPFVDADKDGVADADDKCPAQAQGPTPDPEQPGCPDADDDKDGVLNSQDKCRNQAAGLYPDATLPGCPLPDRDKDTVPDVYDACPDKPGAPSPDLKKNGCPGLVSIDGNVIKILKPVFFAPNKDVILRKSFPVLDAVAGALTATPGIKKVSIQGHTDANGVPEANLDLSQRRAQSVVRWLTEHGVTAERLEAKGFGDTQPVATNKTSRGRAENRRVEFIIVDPPAPSEVKP